MGIITGTLNLEARHLHIAAFKTDLQSVVAHPVRVDVSIKGAVGWVWAGLAWMGSVAGCQVVYHLTHVCQWELVISDAL